jgi:hypothetical protein
VYGKSAQKVYGKTAQSGIEKYARVPDSVLFDHELSLAARSVYGVLARHTFQGTTVNMGQRRIAKLLGTHTETVNLALHELEQRKHICIRGVGKATISALRSSARSSVPESKRSLAVPAARRGWPA